MHPPAEDAKSLGESIPAGDPRLLAQVKDPSVRQQVSDLAELALSALRELQHLDESLYEHFMDGAGPFGGGQTPDAVIQHVVSTTFGGVQRLLEAAAKLAPSESQSSSDGDFELGDLEGAAASAAEAKSDSISLGAEDIGDLLGNIDEHQQEGEPERLKKLIAMVESVAYGIQSQLDDLQRRIEVSMRGKQVGQALEVLDDTQVSVSEGVFALLNAAYETFAPGIDPTTIAPGHLDSLGRALLVRRGLATLSRSVIPINDHMQRESAPPEERTWALDTIRHALGHFLTTRVFKAMRPADRWQLVTFDRRLRSEKPEAQRMTSEGLARYLESLGSINRREVLVNHDQRMTTELRESLSSARELLEINRQVAAQMAHKAWSSSIALYGKRPESDELIVALGFAPPRLETREEINYVIAVAEQILNVAAR